MAIQNAVRTEKTVSDPNAEYDSLKPLWDRSRALCSGEKYVKAADVYIDRIGYSNMLIPFSPSMTDEQYRFYKAEAELPGITAQFAKLLIGGLLRKMPILTLPESAPADAKDWIINNFGKDDSTLISFLDEALWEEIQTNRAWVYVDYPNINNVENLTAEDIKDIKPYPTLWTADSVINWRTSIDMKGKLSLNRVVYRGYVESYEKNEFHPTLIDTIWVHELDETGYYQIRVFEEKSITAEALVISGQKTTNTNTKVFKEVKVITNIMANGERLDSLPIWPLNGRVSPQEPLLSPIIDKEIALYNKMSRRNHLLYGAATYTPILSSDVTDDAFQDIVSAGLGSWIHLRQGDTASILDTPTAALADMDRAIASAIEEMAKLGIRMLTPESNQSGVALEIRNAAQTAQLGTLSTKISNVIAQIIIFMINWRYGTEYVEGEIDFILSEDFNPVPLGADWLRLATEWYREGLIPRSVWLQLLKVNDMIDSDYNDQEGIAEINDDELLMPKADSDYTNKIADEENM